MVSEKHKTYKKLWKLKNRERERENNRRWYLENKLSVKERKHSYYIENSDKEKKRSKLYRNNNKEKISQRQKNNRQVINQYIKHKMTTDVNFKLAARLRIRVYHALKRNKKISSAVEELGCTLPELKTYLESKFLPGMSWDNYNKNGWHIDHVVPLSKFDLTNPEQFRQACHYTNLQPLWAGDNLRKNKYV